MPRGRRDLSGSGRHACKYKGCGKSFHRSYNLKVHQRVHTGDRPYNCPYELCTRKFAWKASLDSHELSHKRNDFDREFELSILAGKENKVGNTQHATAEGDDFATTTSACSVEQLVSDYNMLDDPTSLNRISPTADTTNVVDTADNCLKCFYNEEYSDQVLDEIFKTLPPLKNDLHSFSDQSTNRSPSENSTYLSLSSWRRLS